MKLLTTFTVLLCSSVTIAFAEIRPSEISRTSAETAQGIGPLGEVFIDVADLANPQSFSYSEEIENEITVSVSGSSIAASDAHGSFTIGLEVDIANVDVQCIVSTSATGTVSIIDETDGISVPLTTGPKTLLVGHFYVIHGDCGSAGDFDLTMTWPDPPGPPDGVEILTIDVDGHALFFADIDVIMIRTASTGTGSMTFTGPGELSVFVLGGVTSPTLTIPAGGGDTIITIPVGDHTINLSGFGILEVDFFNDTGGGQPEDINGDGVVDVQDLLLVIAAWSIP